MEESIASIVQHTKFDMDVMLCWINIRDDDCDYESSYGTSGAYGRREPLIDTISSPRDQYERLITT